MPRCQKKKTVINFNYICASLGPERVKELKDLYIHYHKRAMCYKWQWKCIKRLLLFLNMASVGLTSVGTVAGIITLNPIVIGTLTGCGVCLQALIAKKKLGAKARDYKTAFITYTKILNQLKYFLRGVSYDRLMFLTDAKVTDDFVADLGLSIERKAKRYEDIFENAS